MNRDNWHNREFATEWDEAGKLFTNPDRLRLLSLLADLLEASGATRVLDLGIGSALVESAVKQRHPEYYNQCRITGVDASAAMLDLARRRCEGERLGNLDLLQCDFAMIDEVNLGKPPDAA